MPWWEWVLFGLMCVVAAVGLGGTLITVVLAMMFRDGDE